MFIPYRIPNPNVSILDPGSRVKKAPASGPDPQQRIEVFFTQNIDNEIHGNMIRGVYF
jgi:hypothetical protein